LNILLFGSSDVTVSFLEELNRSRHKISAVVTTTDKQAGRGRKVTPGVVKTRALELGEKLIQVDKFDEDFCSRLKKISFDTALVVSFGKIIPAGMFEANNARWLNVHPSLLPRYRGPTPVISTLLNGDRTGGVSIIEVVPEVDAGPIYAQVSFMVEASDDRDSLDHKTVVFGRSLLMTVLDLIEEGKLKPYPQDESGVVYCSKIKKEDLKVNWESTPQEIVNKIRAFSSRPGAYCLWKKMRIKLLKAEVIAGDEKKIYSDDIKGRERSGTVVKADRKAGIFVKCGTDNLIRIDKLQPQGKKVMSSVDFVNGYRLMTGENFG
jgi:methionyl-tRNA formyltransferase